MMIFSKLGRSLSRSARSRFQIVASLSHISILKYVFFFFFHFLFQSIDLGLLIFLHFQSGALGGSGGNPSYLNESILHSRLVGQGDGGLGFSRGYMASIGAEKGFLSKKALQSDLNFLLANPKFCRLFSSEAPKKKGKISSLSQSIYCVKIQILSFFF